VAAAKKKTRKELLNEPDEFMNLSSRMLRYASGHRQEISRIVLALLLVAAVFSGYRLYENRAEARSAELLDLTVSKYERLSQAQSKEKAFQEVSADFKQLVGDYGSRSGGIMARLIWANMCFESGDYRQAAELYKDSLAHFGDFPVVRILVLTSLGHTHERLKELPAALGYFEQALPLAAPGLKPEILFHIAELGRRLGREDKSQEASARILSEHGDSVYAEMVRERVGS
jgi:predicted negative regulator of RcsB-dependent stress response